MATQIENIGTLERKLTLTVAMSDVNAEVEQRLRKLARTVKMSGFRPGKVPMKMVAQSYGGQVHAEVLGDVVGKAFSDGVAEHKLRVAGEPSIERREDSTDETMGFDANFEVYPEIVPPALDSVEVERVVCEVGEPEIEKTLDILRKQRVSWNPVERAAEDGDQLTIDFVGKIDDVAFDGGSAEGFSFVLGEGRMLTDFETALRGMKAGETKASPVAFPEDYGSKDLAGKTANFEITLSKVEAPVLPEIDAEFAKALGQEDGDIDAMRADIKRNLEREVAQRVRGRTKSNVMDALAAACNFELPKALVKSENEALADRAKQDLAARGVDVKDIPVPLDAFAEQAQRRVRLGLLVGEIVGQQKLQAKPDQLRAQIEEFAQAYENPAELVRHYFSDRNRLAEVEAIVIEQNVVDWVLAGAKVADKALSFDELMANG